MNLWNKWNSLPVKARYYIGGSTFVFALLGEYVTTRIEEEKLARADILKQMEKELE
ncbi:hypothetical protein HYPBUDRAFT_153895 [Hyphopichia burtonii NRRL Y-1933]|uniref:Uncharacterized protein n=1 Tax=Hyphopichia burtonii NRRL Y-1933 TaxID=984485 RepID=A0A1E4RET4_9ASCO|nr:hypothetical protein HYPBUDRAFT_153895 [Hyphopichia burtonii NRRL Y-1933]ODV65726.1 hypothetical protein HYPBUDRAFT_153895 [Hyphopichia burtonii NRRL Y-1933]